MQTHTHTHTQQLTATNTRWNSGVTCIAKLVMYYGPQYILPVPVMVHWATVHYYEVWFQLFSLVDLLVCTQSTQANTTQEFTLKPWSNVKRSAHIMLQWRIKDISVAFMERRCMQVHQYEICMHRHRKMCMQKNLSIPNCNFIILNSLLAWESNVFKHSEGWGLANGRVYMLIAMLPLLHTKKWMTMAWTLQLDRGYSTFSNTIIKGLVYR